VTTCNTAEHIKFMQSPDEWPAWPVLPVKKAVAMHNPILGVMIEREGGVQPTVYLVNMYQLANKPLNTIPSETYTDFEGVYDAGWRVD
jgi:hypothetical protein